MHPSPCSETSRSLNLRVFILASFLALGGLAAVGCGGGGDDTTASPATRSTVAKPPTRPEETTPATPSGTSDFAPATCPAGASNCAVATGRIVFIQSYDPDGDGDAHFVLASSDSITGPGISVLDIRKSLRPHPLPPLGTLVSGSGPVYRGSVNQRQVQVDELKVDG